MDARAALQRLEAAHGALVRHQAPPAAKERRQAGAGAERLIGRVVSCSGARATLSTNAGDGAAAAHDSWSIGGIISIAVGASRVVAFVYSIRTNNGAWDETNTNSVSVDVELVGEVNDGPGGQARFKRGVSVYPQIGALAHRIRERDLIAMYDIGPRCGAEVGRLSQNDTIPANISIDDVLNRHFAVVGTTGVGKSCAVSLLVRRCVEARPDLRVVMLDPHNEFAHAFPTESIQFDVSNLDLPFWMFRFEEIEEIIFRGKSDETEADILRELIAAAKAQFAADRTGVGVARRQLDAFAYTADTPSPYRFSDLFKQIEDILGQLEPRYERARLKGLRTRLDSLYTDPRYAFLFGRGMVEDNLAEVLARIFRLSSGDKPVAIVNLAGMPSEVVNSVVSVLARLSFDVAFASHGRCHVLMVCEEAHRYVPQDASIGFRPARRAIARIAKEGRKYGCSVAIVTQRPGELDPTILSQCSTVFAMRLSNDRDQEIIRSAISDSSASTISFLSALDNREAIAFGEGVATSMRLKFTYQDRHMLPEAPGYAVRTGRESARNPVDAAQIAFQLRGGRDALPSEMRRAASDGSAAAAPPAPTLGRRQPAAGFAPPVPEPQAEQARSLAMLRNQLRTSGL
jgi:DNA helicase HerA-like ATPase